MEMQDVLTTVDGKPITTEDIVVHLKCNGTFRSAIYQLIATHVIALKCGELNISITEKEFREYADTKRRMLGLFSTEAMNRYCNWHGIVMGQWKNLVRHEILRNRLKDKIITDKEIEDFFEANRSRFLMAVLSRIVCAEQPEAQRASQQILNHGEDFATVARKVSLERNTRMAGGYLGSIRYGSLPTVINDAVFSASPGSVVGPFEQSGYWALYRIEEIRNAKLDNALKKNISDQLFLKWLQREVLTAKA